jgi:quinol monooxygenase YgiN
MPTEIELPPPIQKLREQVSRMLDTLPPPTPVAATVVFKVDRAQEDEFVRNSDVLAAATRRLPGCSVFAYHEHKPWHEGQSEPGVVQFLIYENWQTRDLFRAQWDSDHLKKFQSLVGGWIKGLPDLNFYYGWSETDEGRVAKTGQRTCWDGRGRPVDCAGTGQDGEYQPGQEWPAPRFAARGDGTVTDRLTGLVWLQDADAFGLQPWERALAEARVLASGHHGLSDGSQPGDWRLPTIRELFSVIDYGHADPILPQGHPFRGVTPSVYWSSTTLAAAPTLAWMMTLGIGPTVFDLKINANRMWPVRAGNSSGVPKTGQTQCWNARGEDVTGRPEAVGQDGQLRPGTPWPTPRFADQGDGTVADNLTGLVWLKNANPFEMRTWEQALMDCAALSSGSDGLTDGSAPGDWRLPTIREIESVVDYGRFGPSVAGGGQGFDRLRPSSYWTSTSVAGAPSEAMFIILGVGPAIFESKEHPFFVWPVRDRKPSGAPARAAADAASGRGGVR